MRRLLLFFLLMASGLSLTQAQKVPLSFNAFHTLGETGAYLKSVAAAYPSITELVSIGQSGEGRDIWLLIVSNRKTGTPLDRFIALRNQRGEVDNVAPMEHHHAKSAHWICGSTHGNEFTGTEVCLYIINKLVSGYGQDAAITDLIDQQAFYICPVVNPDGLFNSVDRDFSQRGNTTKTDDDKDGKINEDGYDDLNGDGRITWFRYRDPKGRYVQDQVNPSIMIRLASDEKTSLETWSMIREDKDNDGDGKRGEDGEQGFDMNRNFPEGWFNDDGYQGGTGDYPTSAPEVRALAEFFTTHPNIYMAQFFHTSGGFTYRPMGSSSDLSMHPKDIAVYDHVLGKRYVELIGEDAASAWQYPDSIPFYKERLAEKKASRYAIQRGYEMPKGWVVSYNEKQDKPYGNGLQADWAYQQLGVLSLTTELWNYRKDLPGYTFEGDDAWVRFQRAAIKYQQEHYQGQYFQEWKAYKHPELGDGEIGGWLPQYGSNNAFPGEPLVNICETHWQYELWRAQLMPRIELTSVSAVELSKSGRTRIIEVSAKVENKGALATHLARGATLPRNRQDVVWLIGDRDKVDFIQGGVFQRIGSLDGQMQIPSQSRGKSSSEVKWIVRMTGDTPLTVVASSQKGGTVSKSVIIK